MLFSDPPPAVVVGAPFAGSGVFASPAGRGLVPGAPLCPGGVFSRMGSAGVAGACVVAVSVHWVVGVGAGS